MLHLYWGDGKGKTTAAMGLALRALGHGRRVVILQFLKDGSSGEIEMLRRCGAVVYACPNAKFTWLMTDAERAEARRTNTRTLQTILQGSFDLLVLDEACAACKNDLVEEALLREAAARAEQVFPHGGQIHVVFDQDVDPERLLENGVQIQLCAVLKARGVQEIPGLAIDVAGGADADAGRADWNKGDRADP